MATSPKEFKRTVERDMRSNNGLSAQEFGKIQKMYNGLHPLAKYSISTWMMGNGYEAVDIGVRSNYQNYLAVGGKAES